MIKKIKNRIKMIGMPVKLYAGAVIVLAIISALAVMNNFVLVSDAVSPPDSSDIIADTGKLTAVDSLKVSTGLTQIYSYEVMYSSNTFVPRIWLKNSTTYIGQLIFKPDGAVLPADGISGDQVNLYYHLQDFENAIDLLRNEAPVYLLYTGPSGENGIRVYPHSVGAGKLKPYVTTTYK